MDCSPPGSSVRLAIYKEGKDVPVVISFLTGEVSVLVTQSCLIMCDPMDCSLPGSSVHGILQARILEWVAISSSRGSS